MNAFLNVVNLFFDPTGRPFGLPDEPSTNRPIEFLLFSGFLVIEVYFLLNIQFFTHEIPCSVHSAFNSVAPPIAISNKLISIGKISNLGLLKLLLNLFVVNLADVPAQEVKNISVKENKIMLVSFFILLEHLSVEELVLKETN